jgi:ERCC4-type nuclease
MEAPEVSAPGAPVAVGPVVALHVDYRERHADANALPGAGVRNLDVGDFVITRGDAVAFVIERKTLSDLASSIVDGRYKSQKERMRALVGGRMARVAYVVEGFCWSLRDDVRVGSVTGQALKTVMYNLQVIEGCSVFTSTGPAQTCEIVRGLYERVCKDAARYAPPDGESASTSASTSAALGAGAGAVRTKRGDNLADPATCAALQLSVVPRVSPEIAVALLSATGSRSMCEFVSNCLDGLTGPDTGPEARLAHVVRRLEGIRVGAAKRALGAALAGRIASALGLVPAAPAEIDPASAG